ncbi:hypothetical protein K435DRAFT_865040 [Dendrothele bispora CBS 962.96]|uniref:Uncharacterized protein n=1 Tax=Dendrothele bispora (strain CBS 962.96) TaxID=1314807 RepID=A0A4S8LL39_DENBC|nr:hypothetical protein K435DRAFT_865040 [Dendrothele bispora CBS 962.96]
MEWALPPTSLYQVPPGKSEASDPSRTTPVTTLNSNRISRADPVRGQCHDASRRKLTPSPELKIAQQAARDMFKASQSSGRSVQPRFFHLQSQKIYARGDHVYLHAAHIQTQIDLEQPYESNPADQLIHPHLARELMSPANMATNVPPPAKRYPVTMPAEAPSIPTVDVSRLQVAQWKTSPEHVQQEIFLATVDNYEAFKVMAFMTIAGKEKFSMYSLWTRIKL